MLPPSEGVCDGNKMTPELCAEGCYAGMRAQAEASGGLVLAGPENGNECFCDVVPEWSGKAWDASRPLTPSKLCNKPCAGGKGDVSLCAPDGYRLCRDDNKDDIWVGGRPEGDMGCGAGWIIDVYVVDCGSDWGWWFLLLLTLSVLGYVGGGLALNHKSRGMPLDRTALPHPVRRDPTTPRSRLTKFVCGPLPCPDTRGSQPSEVQTVNASVFLLPPILSCSPRPWAPS